MLEIMIFGGAGGSNYLPNSGPGNKRVLNGSKQEGWFGLIDSGIMPSIQGIGTAIGMTVVPFSGINTAKPKWLKAVLNDTVIFVPNGPWSDPVYFSDMYRRGAVYGIDDIGPGGMKPDNMAATNQLAYTDWVDPEGRAWLFKVRFIKGHDPIGFTSTSDATTVTAQAGEFWRLFGRVTATSTISASERWDSLVAGVDYQAFRFNDQTFIINGNSHTLSNFTSPDVGQWWSNGVVSSFSWMPVLEVVSPDNEFIYPIGVQITTPAGTPLSPIVSASSGPLITAGDVLVSNQSTIPLAAIVTTKDSLITAGNLLSVGTTVVPINPVLS